MAIAASTTAALLGDTAMTVGPSPFIRKSTDHAKANSSDNQATTSEGMKLIRA